MNRQPFYQPKRLVTEHLMPAGPDGSPLCSGTPGRHFYQCLGKVLLLVPLSHSVSIKISSKCDCQEQDRSTDVFFEALMFV